MLGSALYSHNQPVSAGNVRRPCFGNVFARFVYGLALQILSTLQAFMCWTPAVPWKGVADLEPEFKALLNTLARQN